MYFQKGDVEDLGLCFATDEDAFGTVTTHELKYVSRILSLTWLLIILVDRAAGTLLLPMTINWSISTEWQTTN